MPKRAGRATLAKEFIVKAKMSSQSKASESGKES